MKHFSGVFVCVRERECVRESEKPEVVCVEDCPAVELWKRENKVTLHLVLCQCFCH